MGEWQRIGAVTGLLAPLVLLTGAGADAHEASWFWYYGGGPGSTPTPLLWALAGWLVVWLLGLLGPRWVAAVLAVAAFAGLVVVLVPRFDLVLTATAPLLLLALPATVALLAGPGARAGVAVVGGRRLAVVAALVVLTVFGRVLGHHYAAVDWLLWPALAVAVLWACAAAGTAGRVVAVLLAVPALAALLGQVLPDEFYRWVPAIGLSFELVLPVLLGAIALAVLRSRVRGSAGDAALPR